MDEEKSSQLEEVDNLEDRVDAPMTALEMTGVEMSRSAWWDGLNDWTDECFSKSGTLPFSFDYDGVKSSEFLDNWDLSVEETPWGETRTQRTLTYTDKITGLEVYCEITFFKDHPAAEWFLNFRNTGECDTPIIANIQALDTVLYNDAGRFKLHYTSGAGEGVAAGTADFGPNARELAPDSTLEMSPMHGRSSWGDSLPFFNLEMSNRGVMIGIGWTGQWLASFSRDSDSLRVRAGMELTHLKLLPGEEIRSPRMLLLFWQGHRIYGQNLLRRILLAHYYPQKDGKPMQVPLLASSAGLYHEAFDATEQNQIDYASAFAPLGFEYIWMDVGWQVKSPRVSHIGPADPDRFPDGLRAVTDALKELNMGLLVWFAPEYQGGSTWMEREHPELFLTVKDKEVSGLPPFKMLDFGNLKALGLITDYISNLIREEGIGIYRQDGPIGANLTYPDGRPYPHGQPLQWWRDADAPDRQGIAEIRYIESMYWFWDELRRRNPGLIIDMCGGGATRIDLEAMSRCFYLWRSDHNHPGFEPNDYQSQTYGISPWVPSTATASGYPDAYSFRSSMNAGIAVAWNPFQPEVEQRWPLAFPVNQKEPYELKKVPRKTVDDEEQVGYMVTEPFPWDTARKLIDEYKRIRHLFYGDFYPLTPYSLAHDTWLAYQFHKEELGEGMALAFRRPECPRKTECLKLWGLDMDAHYEVNFEDQNTKVVLNGREMAEGINVTIDSQPGSLLVTYHRIE